MVRIGGENVSKPIPFLQIRSFFGQLQTLQANPLIGLTCLLDVLTDLLACLRTKALIQNHVQHNKATLASRPL